MEYNWDQMFHFNQLETPFEVHVAGIEGECFDYNIYFEDGADEAKLQAVTDAIEKWESKFDEDDYLGYIDITLNDDCIYVYLDLGSIEDCDRSIYGIVEAIKDIAGITRVIVNESLEGMEDFDM